MKPRILMIVPLLAFNANTSPVAGQSFARFTPNDSLSPRELVEEWAGLRSPATEERAFEREGRIRGRGMGITDALRNHRADPERAAAVRDEVERVALRAGEPRLRCSAIRWLTAGFRVGNPDDRAESADTRELARRLERIYATIDDDRYLKVCVMGTASNLGGSGRLHALTWLEPLIVQESEEQAFPKEAFEAMRAAVGLGRPGRALVVRLRDEGRIKDPEARFFSGFMTVEGG